MSKPEDFKRSVLSVGEVAELRADLTAAEARATSLEAELKRITESAAALYHAADEVCEDVSPNSDAALATGSDSAVQAYLILALRRATQAFAALQRNGPDNAG